MARPMPFVDPVTITTLPVRSNKVGGGHSGPHSGSRPVAERLERGRQLAGGRAHDLGAVLEIERVTEAGRVDGLPHRLLRHPHRERSVRRDLTGSDERTVDDGAVVDDVEHEADALGLVGVEHAPGEQQLGRTRRADEAREGDSWCPCRTRRRRA